MDPQSGTMKLRTVDLAGAIPSRLPTTLTDNEETPVWSPDGSRIVFASGRLLFERSSSGAREISPIFELDPF